MSYLRSVDNKHSMSMQKSILQPKKEKLVIRIWYWICETMNQKGEA